MPRYNVASNSATAGNLILDDGEYKFELGTPKTFINYEKDSPDVVRNYGFSVPVTVLDGNHAGRSLGAQRFYLHSEGAVRMTKGFIMAALGFSTNQADENRFNTEYPELWVDPETQELCDAISRVEGKQISAGVKQKENPVREGEVQNQFRWMPV